MPQTPYFCGISPLFLCPKTRLPKRHFSTFAAAKTTPQKNKKTERVTLWVTLWITSSCHFLWLKND